MPAPCSCPGVMMLSWQSAEISLAVESAAKSTGAIDTVATVGVCDVFTRRFVEFHLRLCIEIDAQPQGLEPDCCYYVTNAGRIIGIKRIDLDVDPPPDIAVEIDITNDSLSKFHIYAALEVPEIWRYDGENFQFYQRAGASYHKTAESSVLPGLRPQMLASALEQSKTEGQTAALAAFRKTLTGVSGLRDDPRRSS